MDPNQQDNPSGEPTDAPTPEVTPTPEEPTTPVEPAPEPTLPEQPEAPAEAPLQPTPTETTPDFSAQPIAGQPTTTASPPVSGKPKSKKGLIIGLVAGIGGLLIIGVVLFLILVVFNSGKINSMAELRDAIRDRKAVNCIVSMTQDGATHHDMTIQANDGWSKIHMSFSTPMDIEAWTIKEGDNYITYATTSGYNIKITQDSSTFSPDNMTSNDSIPDDAELKCEPNNKADFTVPDRDWQEAPITNPFE
ncbi:hypothetical protein FWD20_01925 [Candidatus Saccharibacteria bacterium]|nr:hypothetical protein [Candidatus Saccharibacteria bacterium]